MRPALCKAVPPGQRRAEEVLRQVRHQFRNHTLILLGRCDANLCILWTNPRDRKLYAHEDGHGFVLRARGFKRDSASGAEPITRCQFNG